jgi:hypothetical protein
MLQVSVKVGASALVNLGARQTEPVNFRNDGLGLTERNPEPEIAMLDRLTAQVFDVCSKTPGIVGNVGHLDSMPLRVL